MAQPDRENSHTPQGSNPSGALGETHTPWNFTAFNLLNGKVDGIDSRLRRIEYIAWTLMGSIVIVAFVIGTWSPEIHVHVPVASSAPASP